MSTQKEIEDLQKTFQSLDKNNDGKNEIYFILNRYFE